MRKISCPMEIIFIILKGKWSPIILWRLRLENQRIISLKIFLPECNEKVIIEQLKELIKYGVVEKIDFNTYPRHTEYKLTILGRKIIPILEKFQEFGLEYLQKSQLFTL